jgi:hypothetical protein
MGKFLKLLVIISLATSFKAYCSGSDELSELIKSKSYSEESEQNIGLSADNSYINPSANTISGNDQFLSESDDEIIED